MDCGVDDQIDTEFVHTTSYGIRVTDWVTWNVNQSAGKNAEVLKLIFLTRLGNGRQSDSSNKNLTLWRELKIRVEIGN